MMTTRNHSFMQAGFFRFGTFLLLCALVLAGCFQEKLPAHSLGHKHKQIGVQEGQHLRYQDPDRSL